MRLYVNDVAVRDGFQIEKNFVPTATKVELINQLSRTGLHRIEATSFVSAKAVPMLADANEVLAGIDRVPGVIYVALVPNLRGVHNAAAARSCCPGSSRAFRRRRGAPAGSGRGWASTPTRFSLPWGSAPARSPRSGGAASSPRE